MSNEITISQKDIENKIFVFRDVQVMIDRDLAEMYQVETIVLNQAVKRNLERFPKIFRFQLSDSEFENWKSQIVMSNEDKMGLRRPPYVFTEQGVAMLSAVLNSDTAINVSIQIMDAFVKMRQILLENSLINFRLDKVELKQLDNEQRFEQVFKALDVKKANAQYGNFEIKSFNKSHDRFLIIDNTEVYHLGASLKDLGKKWFAFSKLDKNPVETILKSLSNE